MEIIHSISTLLTDIDPRTLFVFDIDYTLFRSRNNLGSPEWIHYLIDQEVKAGLSLAQGFSKWYPAWMKAQKIADLELMEDRIPDMLKTLETSSAGFIALTARGPLSAAVTHEQFESLGLRFDTRAISQLSFSLEFNNPVLLEKGILFVHEFNKKGSVFLAWFKKAKTLLSEVANIRKVVFIDDTEKHVHSMREAVLELGLEYKGYHYIKADHYKAQLNSNLVLHQANILSENHSEAEIKMLLNLDPV